jgi:hypothetical protein
MNRPRVDPAFTFGISFAISLALWLPTLRDTMNGEVEITDSAIRYFLALAIAWAAVTVVSAIVTMFASESRGPVSPPPDRPGARDVSPASRRADDDAPEAREALESDAA